MNPKLNDLIESFQSKRWFPGKYPDPYGELLDYLSLEAITNLVEDWQNTGSRTTLATAYYLLRLLPSLVFKDLHSDLVKAAKDPVDTGVPAHHVFYYIRSFPLQRSANVWNKLKEWADRWESVLFDWLTAEIRLDHSFPEVVQKLTPPQSGSLEKELSASRELFSLKLQRTVASAGLREIVSAFRLRNRDGIADWSDFAAFARTIIENGDLKKSPSLQKNAEDAAAQVLFPIAPPARVLLEYGEAAGPVDALRFLFEFGKGLFYTGIDPDSPADHRISGDPGLPCFWGSIYANLMTDRSSLQRLISPAAEDLADEMNLVLEFWYRSDAFLALYRENANASLDNLKDVYLRAFESAFSFHAPDFLYLYELLRSAESPFRARAMKHAIAAVERFRELYGRHWFANPRYVRRVREYWWNGFALTSTEILADLGVPDPTDYPFIGT